MAQAKGKWTNKGTESIWDSFEHTHDP